MSWTTVFLSNLLQKFFNFSVQIFVRPSVSFCGNSNKCISPPIISTQQVPYWLSWWPATKSMRSAPPLACTSTKQFVVRFRTDDRIVAAQNGISSASADFPPRRVSFHPAEITPNLPTATIPSAPLLRSPNRPWHVTGQDPGPPRLLPAVRIHHDPLGRWLQRLAGPRGHGNERGKPLRVRQGPGVRSQLQRTGPARNGAIARLPDAGLPPQAPTCPAIVLPFRSTLWPTWTCREKRPTTRNWFTG